MFAVANTKTLHKGNLLHNLQLAMMQWLVKQLMEMIQENENLRVAVDFIY